MSRSIRIVTVLFCVFAFVVGSLPGARVATAQGSVAGEATGVMVTFGPEWALVHEAVNADSSVDYLMLANGNVNVSIVSYANGAPDVSAGLSLIPGDAAITDIDASGTYALYSVDANGRSYGVFSVVVGSEVQTVIAPTSGFANAIESAQADIQINGSVAFNGVDGEALAPAITFGATDAAADAELPALVPVVDSATNSGDTEAGDVTADATADVATDDAIADDGAEGDASAPADPSETGFVNDNTWVSPQHGTTLVWGDGWEPRTSDEAGNPTFLTMDLSDIVCLKSTDPENEGAYCISARPHSDFDGTQEHWNSRFLDPEARGNYGLPRLAVAVTAEGFAYGDTSLDLEQAIISQGQVNNGIYVETYIRGPLNQLPLLLAPAQSQITVDGTPAFHLLDAATFTSEAESMAARVPELVAERDARLQQMGLIDPNHYASVATGCDIAWDDTFVIEMGSTLEPIYAVPAWDWETGEEVPGERFNLTQSESSIDLSVSCFADSGAWEGDYWWSDAGFTAIDGENVRYGISPNMEGYHEIYVIVTSSTSPVLVEITLYVSAEELGGLLDSSGAGGLVVNGADVFQNMKDIDLMGQLP